MTTNSVRINPTYKLEKWTLIYAKHKGGKSLNYLGRAYEVSPQAIRNGIKTFEAYLRAGLVEEPEAIYE